MKKYGLILVSVLSVIFQAACSSTEPFDARGYVQGVLDATYHGEYAAYADAVGESEDALGEELRNSDYENAKETLDGIGFPVTEEQVQQYVDVLSEAYKKVEYTVGESEEDEEGNFTVDVTVVPVGVLDSLEEIYASKLTDALSSGATESEYMDVFLASVKESVDAAESYDPVTISMHVTYTEDQDDNRIYSIDENDLAAFDKAAIHQ